MAALAVAYDFKQILSEAQPRQEREKHLKAVPNVAYVDKSSLRFPSKTYETDLTSVYSGPATWTLIQERTGYNVSCNVNGMVLPIQSRSFTYQGILDRLYGMAGAGKTRDRAIEFARTYSPEAGFDKNDSWTGEVSNIRNERARSREDRKWASKYVSEHPPKK
ncbi:MAG: hypothetical protein HY831_00585 [Candidatus Aenigmarchaeota archaeon]|nr:hypothetical protein [Candidatus Aenigmarchaeota archaeon]